MPRVAEASNWLAISRSENFPAANHRLVGKDKSLWPRVAIFSRLPALFAVPDPRHVSGSQITVAPLRSEPLGRNEIRCWKQQVLVRVNQLPVH
jgi:hypothetical protein